MEKKTSTLKKTGIILLSAFVGWALCGGTMMGGLALTTELNAMIIHAIAAPIFFFGVSWVYFTKFNYTDALRTGLIFIIFIVFMDVFVVSMLINKNFDMFSSILGFWIPMASIFTSTYLTGLKFS
ncbi:MAG: hypothetical protein INQ03_23940 [Candidatus Heimdallarchaeota archaeon]|nr:hypothetical protein [Candidatus Heimdallarchaeota archaeon]